MRFVFLAIFSVLLVTVLGSMNAHAQEGGVISVSPVRQALTVSPGRTGQVLVTVSNPTGSPLRFQPIVEDFTAGDSSGVPQFISGGSRSFKRFVQALAELTVPAGSDETIRLQVVVPANTAPGGYYGALRLVQSDATSGNSPVTTSGSSLILLTVAGDLKEQLSLAFTVPTPEHTPSFGSVWLGGGKTSVSTVFTNAGDTHEAPKGQVYITKDERIVSQYEFNQAGTPSYVLPGSSRSWKTEIMVPTEFGRYTVGGVFTYGQVNKTLETSRSFWVIPFIFVVVGLGSIVPLIVVAVTWFRWRRRRDSFGFK